MQARDRALLSASRRAVRNGVRTSTVSDDDGFERSRRTGVKKRQGGLRVSASLSHVSLHMSIAHATK